MDVVFRLQLFCLMVAITTTCIADEVPLQVNGGVYTTPIIFNDTIKIQAILDSGASDIFIPIDVASVLVRTGTINDSDDLGDKRYQTADGTIHTQMRVNIKKLTIGNRDFYNIPATISKTGNGDVLLGQSFLKRLSSWSIDNSRHVLIFEFNELTNSSQFTIWTTIDTNDIETVATDMPCSVPSLLDKSLPFTILQTIPTTRIKRKAQIIFNVEDRTATVMGCWSPSSHTAILIRREDNKTWVLSNFHVDNTWTKQAIPTE